MAAQYNTNDTSESRPPFNATGVDNSQRAADSLLNLANGTGHIPIISEDDALLESLGYRPELKREFSYLTVFGQSFGAMGIAPAIAESMIFSLGSAGSPGMVWTYLVGCLSLMPVAFSLGELGSSMPTAGGLYYWVAMLTPEKWRAYMCWLAGYMNVVGYISIYASTNYGATLILVAAISIGDGFNPYDASPTGWVSTKYSNYGIFVATIILTLFMTSVSSRTLAKLNTAYIYLQFAIVLATIIALAAATPSSFKNSASFVFSDFENTGFWINNGWTFMLCFLTPVWVVSGFESSVTIAEEAANAAKAVPFAMISSLAAATVAGWALVITIAFCMGTNLIGLDASVPVGTGIAVSSLGQPMAMIAFNSFGEKGSVAFLVFLWWSSICNCSILMVAASRETFAFARDHGLPGSTWIRVLAKDTAPYRAVLFVAICSIVEGLLMLVNTIAINSIFNLAIMGLYFAYCMPLIARIVFGNFKPGVWYLGDRLSYISAVYSVGWMFFVFILLIFPIHPDPDAKKMNYAVVVLGFVLIFCTVYWWIPKFGGRHFFTGPVRTVDEPVIGNAELEQEIEKSVVEGFKDGTN